MKKILLIISIALISFSLSYSQYVENAFRFSNNDYSGTARFVGMGGAFGALGGDFSAIAINPAGLGVYRNSEFSFSPGMGYNSNSSIYYNNKVDESAYNMNFNNLGFVASYDLENTDTRWVNFNFAVGFNRINDFNDNIHFSGVSNSSLLEIFNAEANNANTSDSYDLDGMYEFLIWDSYIMNYDTVAGEFYTNITDEIALDPDNFSINQRKIIEREGSINEFNFSFGGNYAHKLYVGLSIGITRLSYDEYTSHYEFETAGTPILDLDGFDFRTHSKIEGTGYNLKIGAIYKPVDFVRFGASLHVPTFYDLEQEFYNDVIGYFEVPPTESSKSPIQNYSYSLVTPLRAVGSVGFQIGKIALIDIDYEYADYSKMKMDDEFNSDGVIDDNSFIQNNFGKSHNLRAGAEFRTGPLYFRAGGRYSTSPYDSDEELINEDYQQITLAGGLGYREKNFFIDFAFAQKSSSYNVIAYDLNSYYDSYQNEEASIDNKLNKFILTIGFKF